MELFLTLFSIWFLWVIISPSIVILLDFDLISLPSFIVYSLGYQWAWSFNLILPNLSLNNLIFLNTFNIFNFDHYVVSSFSFTSLYSSIYYLSDSSITRSSFSSFSSFSLDSLYSNNTNILSGSNGINSNNICAPYYLFDINRYLILPLWSTLKIFVFSFDVIHSLGFYSFGIKIDAIPGRINLSSTLRGLMKGEHRGFCFELCGQGHSSMLMVSILLIV